MSLKVAIIGRPNVGKSTLFNKLIGKYLAITAEEAGTTRDRIEREVTLNRVRFTLVDAGGIETTRGGDLDDDIQAQVRYAIAHSDLLLFLVDAKSEITAEDSKVAELLRKTSKPIIFVANKFESDNISRLMNFTSFGFGVPIGISAIHKTGLDELISTLTKNLRNLARKKKLVPAEAGSQKKKHEYTKSSSGENEQAMIKVAFAGRPNVGKSSLVNKILGEERFIVSEIPLTTRDVGDVVVEIEGKKFQLLDTAGMRRSGKVGRGIDRFATGRTLNALSDAEVALLLFSGDEGIVSQDLHVAEKILAAGCGLLLVVNKTDLWEDFTEEQEKWLANLTRKFQFARWAAVVMVSAKTGKNIPQIFKQILEIQKERTKRIKTNEFNLFLKKIIAQHSPAQTDKAKMPPKIFYATQLREEKIPTFALFVNRPRAFHFSYRRFLENRIREKYGFNGIPIKLEFRERKREDRGEAVRTKSKRVEK
ncbi:ribosome biogenesis GTPase Der [Patescibacteria group bacterium]|nr:ribosome biogenesis GTPase Der [Patescibacteria group bacterium]